VSEHRINLTLYKLPQILEGEALARSSTRLSPNTKPNCSREETA